MTKLQNKLQEVKAIKASITQETQQVFESILARLSNVEASKESTIMYELQQLRTDLDCIQHYVHKVSSAISKSQLPTCTAEDIDAFLNNFPEYLKECKYLSMKPHKTEITVRTDDFPREVQQRTAMEQRYMNGEYH